MNREILFRGKRSDNGEWAYGYFAHINSDKRDVIITQDDETEYSGLLYRTVEPETVGQYTGLTDKNGKRIFEGDIINVPIRMIDGRDVFEDRFVEFADGMFCAGSDSLTRWLFDSISGNIALQNVDVIGNIHDNKEFDAQNGEKKEDS